MVRYELANAIGCQHPNKSSKEPKTLKKAVLQVTLSSSIVAQNLVRNKPAEMCYWIAIYKTLDPLRRHAVLLTNTFAII